LIHLMRGGADVEMLCSAAASASAQHLAKQLCARFIRAGDELAFPELRNALGRADIVIGIGPDRLLSAFLVHRRDEPFTLSLQDAPMLEQCRHVLKIDATTKGKIVESYFDGVLRMEGYGVAVLASREAASQ